MAKKTNPVIFGLHYQIRHGLLLECFTGLQQSGGKVVPSMGIYYVAPMNRGWQVMTCRYSDGGEEIDHTKFWERHVCRRLAGLWSTRVTISFNSLSKLLKEHPYGFPRGRVVCDGAEYMVYHGSNIPKGSMVTRGQIEAIFGIKGKAKWITDDHERCLIADKMAIRDLLALEEDWPAV
jgi:hypothetical protein